MSIIQLFNLYPQRHRLTQSGIKLIHSPLNYIYDQSEPLEILTKNDNLMDVLILKQAHLLYHSYFIFQLIGNQTGSFEFTKYSNDFRGSFVGNILQDYILLKVW